MSFIWSFNIIIMVLLWKAEEKGRWCKEEEEEWWRPDPDIFLCIPASAADAADGLITLFICGNPVFSNGPRSLPRNPPDCITLDIRVFDNLISFDDLPAKPLRRFAARWLVNNNLWGKLVSSSSITFDCNLKITSVLFF